MLADLRSKIREVHDVAVTLNMCYVVQLSVDGARQAASVLRRSCIVPCGLGQLPARAGAAPLLVIVVGPDVDPYDMDSVGGRS